METQNSIKEQLLKLEELLLQPKIRKSPEELSNILSEDFIEFGSSGIIYSREQIIDALQQESTIQMTIKNFQIKKLANDIVLATYQIISHNELKRQATYSMRSSIWKYLDERWRMLFHQGTPTTKDYI